jgi:hypothetical protein
MTNSDRPFLLQEAEYCRRQATVFVGKPEAPFLLRMADTYEEMAAAPLPTERSS